MTNQQDALQEILSIAKNNNLTINDVTKAFSNTDQQKEKTVSTLLAKLFSYVGGIFIFVGLCFFVEMQWDDMGSAARVVITLGSGFSIFLMGVICFHDKKFQRAITPLFIISTPLQTGGIFVMLDEYAAGDNPQHGILFMSTVMLLQHGAVFLSSRRTVLAFTSIIFATTLFTTTFDMWEINENLIGTIIGTSLLCIAYAANNSRHIAISPFFYFVGSITLLFATFNAIKGEAFEAVFLGLSIFLIFISTLTKSRPLLLVSTIATVSYISYFTAEHFADVIGWPMVLIFIGLISVGLGSLAMRINNKYIK